jgi:PilZ domain
MDKNRRRFLRKVPDDVAFIQIERDEVGKVLNVSEGGLSFKSVTPVPRNLPVYFWFSFNLQDRIEAMGEVAWTDLSRTVGGLRFTQISEASREQLKKWMSRLGAEKVRRKMEAEGEIPVGNDEVTPQLVAAGERAPTLHTTRNEPARKNGVQVKTSEPDRVAKFVSKARAHRPIPILSFEGKTAIERIAANAKVEPPPELRVAPPPVSALAAVAAQPALGIAHAPALESELPKGGSYRSMFSMETESTKAEADDPKSPSLPFRGLESLVELVPLQRYLSAKKRQLLCGVFLGVCLSAAVTIPVVKFSTSRAHADAKPPAADSSSLKNSLTGEPSTTTSATLPQAQSQAKPTYPVAGIFSDSTPVRKGTTQSQASRSQLADFYRYDPPKTVPAKAAKTPAGTTVQAKSGNTSTTNTKKSGMNPNQLWGEVQAGSSNAAVELADLYIKGDGVPKNCQQARVLLLMASEKRNTAAIKRLHDLDKGATCP